MSNDIDFEQLIALLDRAITSKDPKVTQALKKFLFIAALATEDDAEPGPFARLVERLEEMEQRLGALEHRGMWTTTSPPSIWDVKYGSGTSGGCFGQGTSQWYYNAKDSTSNTFLSGIDNCTTISYPSAGTGINTSGPTSFASYASIEEKDEQITKTLAELTEMAKLSN